LLSLAAVALTGCCCSYWLLLPSPAAAALTGYCCSHWLLLLSLAAAALGFSVFSTSCTPLV
jgi:hypothetical protein